MSFDKMLSEKIKIWDTVSRTETPYDVAGYSVFMARQTGRTERLINALISNYLKSIIENKPESLIVLVSFLPLVIYDHLSMLYSFK